MHFKSYSQVNNNKNRAHCETSMKLGTNSHQGMRFPDQSLATQKIQYGGHFKDGRRADPPKIHFHQEIHVLLTF